MYESFSPNATVAVSNNCHGETIQAGFWLAHNAFCETCENGITGNLQLVI